MIQDDANAMATGMHGSQRHRLPIAMVAFCLLSLTGCSPKHVGWSEEVVLPDATVIVVDRTTRSIPWGEFGGPPGDKPVELTLQIPPAATRGAPPPPQWRSTYLPLLLDHDASAQTWSLVTMFVLCDDWRDAGRPAEYYQQFQSRRGGAWIRVPLDDSRRGQPTNMLADLPRPGQYATTVNRWVKATQARGMYAHLQKIGVDARELCLRDVER